MRRGVRDGTGFFRGMGGKFRITASVRVTWHGKDCARASPADLICSADLQQVWKDFPPQSPLTLLPSRNPLQSSLAVTTRTSYTVRQRKSEVKRREERRGKFTHTNKSFNKLATILHWIFFSLRKHSLKPCWHKSLKIEGAVTGLTDSSSWERQSSLQVLVKKHRLAWWLDIWRLQSDALCAEGCGRKGILGTG